MEMLTPEDIELLGGRSHGHLVTLNADGTPHATPVWVGADPEGNILVNTAVGRKKDRNMRRDPRVAVSVQDHEDPYRWLSVTGTVIGRLEGDEALAQMTDFSMTYTGTPWEPVDGQVRVLYTIRPDRVARSED
jgi:PPOX class probable F420-dependent enzyme